MKKHLLSLFLLLFIPSLIASCDTKIEESKNNDNNSSITKTSVEDSSRTREKDSFPEKSSSSYDISSSVKTEPYGYTIEDGKMVVDVSLNGSSINDNRFPFQIESGNTYDLHELDCLYLTTSINVKNVTSNNESVEIFRNDNSPQIGLYFHDFGTAQITINYENEDYDFFFNIIEIETLQTKFIATQVESLYCGELDNDIGYLRCGKRKFDVIPGCEYTLSYKGSWHILTEIPGYYVFDYNNKFISFEKTKDSTIETFIVRDGIVYKNGSEESYPLVYTLKITYSDNVKDFAIDENGNKILISKLQDETILYGYVNDGIVYGYYTYDVNIQDPIIIKDFYIKE